MSIDRDSDFWSYLPREQQDLIEVGEYLFSDVVNDHKFNFKDYSFIVFPYAKAYEGFLKKLFVDTGYISQIDYISDHFRIGKVLSPNLMGRLAKRSLYKQIMTHYGRTLAEEIWEAWKFCRNQIFHYFPQNIKAISLSDAREKSTQIVAAMQHAYVAMLESRGESQLPT